MTYLCFELEISCLLNCDILNCDIGKLWLVIFRIKYSWLLIINSDVSDHHHECQNVPGREEGWVPQVPWESWWFKSIHKQYAFKILYNQLWYYQEFLSFSPSLWYSCMRWSFLKIEISRPVIISLFIVGTWEAKWWAFLHEEGGKEKLKNKTTKLK